MLQKMHYFSVRAPKAAFFFFSFFFNILMHQLAHHSSAAFCSLRPCVFVWTWSITNGSTFPPEYQYKLRVGNPWEFGEKCGWRWRSVWKLISIHLITMALKQTNNIEVMCTLPSSVCITVAAVLDVVMRMRPGGEEYADALFKLNGSCAVNFHLMEYQWDGWILKQSVCLHDTGVLRGNVLIWKACD